MAEHDLRAAAEAANRLISRIEEIVADHLQPGRDADEARGFYEIVKVLEDSHDVAVLREALGDSPTRFGEPTPYAAGDHTG
ncbi:hypothetical protein [Phenylobacterium soli]|nr:hypothetical protein [Phenylobacterium soli]